MHPDLMPTSFLPLLPEPQPLLLPLISCLTQPPPQVLLDRLQVQPTLPSQLLACPLLMPTSALWKVGL